MVQHEHGRERPTRGPGEVTLEQFVAERLDEEERAADETTESAATEAHTRAVVAAHRLMVEAYLTARTPMQRAAAGYSLKALATVWADHPDYSPMWRL